MKTILTFIGSAICFVLLGGLLWSCENWALPTKKTQRDCGKPAGTLTYQAQQRKVDFSITGTSGTIDKVSWDFGYSGAGSTTATTGLTASFTYPVSGTYTAKATLSNSCTQETILTTQVIVSDATPPTVSLQAATNITLSSALLGMTVTSNGNATITRYGICYSSVNPVPTTSDSVRYTNGTIGNNVPVTFLPTNLQPNTTYYVRSFAINQANPNPGYSSTVQSFRTGSEPSISLVSTPITGVTSSTVGIVITNSGNPAAVEYGICYSASNNDPKVDNATTKVVASPTVSTNLNVDLTNLTPNTRYYYRAYAKLPDGSYKYFTVQTFTTQVDRLAVDLIAYVPFTDESYDDVTGNGNNINPKNSPTFVTDHTGKAKSAISLNGLGDYLYMSDNSMLRPDAFSISIWIKPTSLDRDPDGWMQIYNKSRFDDGANEMYSALIRPTIGSPGITINTDIKQGSNCQNGRWQTLTVASGIELSKWYHIVFTYDGSQTGRMYINGTLLYTKRDFAATGIDKCPGGELKFGAQGKSDTNYFYGAMDDIRMYKRVLTDGEVQSLYNQ